MKTLLGNIEKSLTQTLYFDMILIIKFIILKYQYKITIIRIMPIVRDNKNCSNVSKNKNYIISLKYSGSKKKKID